MFRPPMGAPPGAPPPNFARPPPAPQSTAAVADARKRAAEAASRVLGADATGDFVYQARREQEQAEQLAATQRAFEHQYIQQQLAQAQAVSLWPLTSNGNTLCLSLMLCRAMLQSTAAMRPALPRRRWSSPRCPRQRNPRSSPTGKAVARSGLIPPWTNGTQVQMDHAWI